MEQTPTGLVVMLGLDQVEEIAFGPGERDGIRMPRKIMPVETGAGWTAEGTATVDSPTTIVGVSRVVPELLMRE